MIKTQTRIQYKFFHNGNDWWLRISTFEELAQWLEDTDSMWSEAFNDAITPLTPEHAHNQNPLGATIYQLAQAKKTSIIDSLFSIKTEAALAKFTIFNKNGFLNINSYGGFNSIDCPMLQVEYRDKLIFPHYSESDIRITTFQSTAYIEGHKYHYYAYIGNIQVKDGDTSKWDSYAEAYDVAQKFVE